MMDWTKMRVTALRGRYNLLDPSEEQVNLAITGLPAEAPHRSLQMTLDSEVVEDFDLDEADEVLDAIEGKLRRIWSSSKERDMACLAWLREHETEMQNAMHLREALSIQRQCASLYRRLDGIMACIRERRAEMGE